MARGGARCGAGCRHFRTCPSRRLSRPPSDPPWHVGAAGAHMFPPPWGWACRKPKRYVGMRCGILDQFASIFAHHGAASLIDCRQLRVDQVNFGADDCVFVVCDTTKARDLAASDEYNKRREQCDAAAEALGVEKLRDATMDELLRHRSRMPEVAFRRARHVVSENRRVLQGVEALGRGDFPKLGRLLCLTHESLRDDYEVSCTELDEMVRAACSTPGCLGARLIGAGFGGCVLAVVRVAEASAFCDAVKRPTPRAPQDRAHLHYLTGLRSPNAYRPARGPSRRRGQWAHHFPLTPGSPVHPLWASSLCSTPPIALRRWPFGRMSLWPILLSRVLQRVSEEDRDAWVQDIRRSLGDRSPSGHHGDCRAQWHRQEQCDRRHHLGARGAEQPRPAYRRVPGCDLRRLENRRPWDGEVSITVDNTDGACPRLRRDRVARRLFLEILYLLIAPPPDSGHP